MYSVYIYNTYIKITTNCITIFGNNLLFTKLFIHLSIIYKINKKKYIYIKY